MTNQSESERRGTTRTADDTRRIHTCVVALVFLLTIEMVRFHVASLGWYQRDTLGVGAIDLIPIAVIPFLGAALLPILTGLISVRTAWTIGLTGLVIGRVMTQVVADPGIVHWTSALAVASGLGLLTLAVGLGRMVFTLGLVAGIAIDAAIKAQGRSLDLAHRAGFTPVVAMVLIASALVYLAASAPPEGRHGPVWRSAGSLIGIGPLLFVQYLVLQSPGWISSVTGIPGRWAGLAIVVLDLIALGLVSRTGARPALTLAAVVAALGAMLASAGPGWLFGIAAALAIVLAGPLVAALVPEPDQPRVAPGAVALTVGYLLFLIVGFAYYLPLDLHIGVEQPGARLIGAILLAVAGLAVVGRSTEPTHTLPGWVATLVVLPLAGLLINPLGTSGLGPVPAEGPATFMAYNIHQAFGTGGEMGVAAVAEVIAEGDASVVGLQEVARGGLLNAGTDLLTLLGAEWEYSAFFGTTDPTWGNAILSRHPLGEVERVLLPKEGTPYQRGYLAAPADTPIGEVLFISTHLQHVDDPAVHATDPEGDLYDVHTAQLGTVGEAWAGRTPAVLVGDLNARPEWQQVADLLDAGWVDAWAEAGDGPGYTANAALPEYRIDYVFHTPDLTTDGVRLIESQASDHFAVVARLARR